MNPITVALVAALACLMCACQPLNGIDPLDSGEFSAAMMQPMSSQGDRLAERQHYDARVQRLSGEAEYGSEVRKSAGVTVLTDF